MEKYDPTKIEAKWQAIWAETNYARAENFADKPIFYSLIEFPYPSGYGLHVGHCMMYTAADAHARMLRMRGFNVLFPMGWDAFGLPTENYAIKNKIKPQTATAENVANFKRQDQSLGYSFDWSREIDTTSPEYYRWTQWIFLQFYKHGYRDGKLIPVADDDTTTPRLAHQAKMPVNWCPKDKIILANEEVINGRCERCGTLAEKRQQTQWLLRITAYADRLIHDLDTVDYLDKIKTQQINWIGRSEGAHIDFSLVADGEFINEKIKVFTTRADTLFGCTYVVIAPEHQLIAALLSHAKNKDEINNYIAEAKNKSDLERTELQKIKTGVEIKGVVAINPINNQSVPVWVADYVLASYGTGAVMAVPAHDERDFEFAKKYNLPIIRSVGKTEDDTDELSEAFIDYGVAVNSGEFSGLSSVEAKRKITDKLKSIGAGDFTVTYKLRDWIFSRQHYWGEPIPIVHCDTCGTVPLPESELPLTLPEVENYEPTDTGESPLAAITDWVNVSCPRCGGPAKRETDTMPNWAGSSWYYLRFCDPHNNNVLADRKKLDYWLPVTLYNGGNEHTTLHLLYSRFWHKFLFDLGVVPGAEPYAKRIAHGLILGPDGQKMSKSRGNVINPDDMRELYGADALRTYIMFIGPYDQDSAWNDAGIRGVSRFMARVWASQALVDDNPDDANLLVKLNQTVVGVTSDLETFHMNTVISKLMELLNTIERIGRVSRESYSVFLRLLFPPAPHIASELWERLGFGDRIDSEQWPEANPNYLIADEVSVAVQVNGKVRDVVTVPSSSPEVVVAEVARQSEKVQPFLDGRAVAKVIYIAGKVINFVVE